MLKDMKEGEGEALEAKKQMLIEQNQMLFEKDGPDYGDNVFDDKNDEDQSIDQNDLEEGHGHEDLGH